MHIQPNSSQIRKYIPRQTYFQMLDEQRNPSYIGFPLSLTNEERIRQRIEQLEEKEQLGFVYIGEKNWLQTYLQNNKSSQFESYDQWVKHNFENYLGLQFKISNEYDHLDYILWQAELDSKGIQLGYDDLKNSAFLELEELDVFVRGDEQAPNVTYLVQAFEVLHNLEYAISTLKYKGSVQGEISATGIDVSNQVNPRRWELNVISSYGADWDFSFIDGFAWGQKSE